MPYFVFRIVTYLAYFFPLFCVFSYTIASQETHNPILLNENDFPHWRHWNKENGLQKDWVNCFEEDFFGNIIINQGEYASIYDGYTFRSIPSPDGYTRIYQNLDGQFCTEDHRGLKILENNQWVLHELGEDNTFPTGTDYLVTFKKDKFYLLNQNELIYYDAVLKEKKVLKRAIETPLEAFNKMVSSPEGNILILGIKGVAEIILQNHQWNEMVEWNYYLFPNDIQYTRPLSFYCYPNREYAVSLLTGNKKNRHFLHFKNNQWTVRCSGDFAFGWLGPNDGIWLTRLNEDESRFTLLFYNNDIWYQIEPNKFNSTIYFIVSNKKESFWINNSNGLTQFSAPLWRQEYSFPDQKDIGIIMSGLKDSSDNTWIVSDNKLFEKKDKQWLSYNLPIEEDIGFITPGSLIEAPNQSVYIKGSRAIAHFDSDSKQFKLINHPNFPEDKYVFMGSHVTLPDQTLMMCVFDSKNKIPYLERFNHQSFEPMYDFSTINPQSSISSIVPVDQNEFWLETGNKIFGIKNGEIFRPNLSKQLENFNINTLVKRNNGTVWIESSDSFLIYDGNQIVRENKPDIDRFFSFQETTDGVIWFTSNKGVHRYFQNSFILNNFEEGLFDSPVNFLLQLSEDHFLAGGDLGLRQFDRQLDQDPPDTAIPSELNSHEFSQNALLRFHFDGIDRWNFTPKVRLLYSYKINQESWSPFQEKSEITIDQFQPGNYTLSVRAMDRNLNIDPTPAIFKFQIMPPWYLEPAFLVWSVFASFITCIFGYAAVRNYLHLNRSLIKTQQTVNVLEQTKEDLIRAKVSAESATKAKDSFLARMSHEIRTPLNGIVGNLELLSIVKSEEQKSDLIRLSNLSAQTLQGIIGDVLDFAKIEADLFELDQVEVTLQVVIEEVFSMLCVRASQKQLVMIADLDPNLPVKVHSDPIRLRQVLINLINNAIKFTENGGIFIRVYCKNVTTEISEICFEILDTGSGFEPSKKQDIFKEFVQDGTSKKMSEGTGLGLPICKRIVQLMGGKIDCEGFPGVGSKFWFSIPFQVVEGPCPPKTNLFVPKLVILQLEDVKFGNQIHSALHQSSYAYDQLKSVDEVDVSSGYHFVIVFANQLWNNAVQTLQSILPAQTKYILITDNNDPYIPFTAFRAGYHYIFQQPVDTKYLIHLLSSPGQFLQMTNEQSEKKINIDEIIKTVSIPDEILPALVIDDVKTNQLLTKNQLKQINLKCDVASSGIKALELLNEKDYSIIFVDCSMPEMDGFEFTRLYRELEINKHKKTPIVAMTAHVLTGIRERCFDSGMDDYISKPVRLEVLVSKIQKWLLKNENETSTV